MPIPELTADGFLPPGVYECSLQEIGARFGVFQRSDRRMRFFHQLESFVEAVIATKLVTSLLVDGSFVTAKQEPGDIDLVVVVTPDHDFGMLRRPFEYNVLSKRRVQRSYGFDVLVAREGSTALAEYTAFFQQVRGQPGARKGILRLGVSP